MMVEIAVFGSDAKRAAEKLGVTVGGDWANRPSVAIEDVAALLQLGLEFVEGADHRRPRPASPGGAGRARLTAEHQQAGWARPTDRGGRPASDGL